MIRATSVALAMTVSLSASAQTARPIVAVLSVQDKAGFLTPAVAEQLTDYLTVQVAQTGAYQTVPSDQVKARLRQLKIESYKSCYDEQCQIAIGRELAAQKSLTAQISKFGTRCVVMLTVFDLKAATAERAASAKGDCAQDSLVAMIDHAVESIRAQGQDLPVRAPESDASLLVNSAPAGAAVWLDGARIPGVTPLKISRIAPGRHFLEIRRGDDRASQRLTISPQQEAVVSLRLVSLRGKLEITSAPPEAEVFVNQRLVGKTPLALADVPPGKHDIVLRKPGYLNATQSVQVRGSKQWVHVALAKATTIALRSDPLGAKVTFDGATVGRTPVELFVKPGTYHIAVQQAGFQTWTHTVSVEAEGTRLIAVKLREESPSPAVAPSPRVSDGPRTPLWGQIALGVGVTTAALAGILYTVGKVQGDAAHEDYRAATNPDVILARWDDVQRAQSKVTAGHVLIGVAAVSTGAWLYSYLTRRKTPQVSRMRVSWMATQLRVGF